MMGSRCLVVAFALGGLLGGCSSSTGSEEPLQGRLVVGEFLYRTGTDTLEWIELRNDGGASAPLAGVRIEGVGFAFPDTVHALPAGARVVLTNSPALFAARHPGTAISGVFPGRLADEGEKLALVQGESEIFAVSWSSDEPWPQACALDGASLVWTGGDSRSSASWAASATAGGTPGLTDVAAADPGVLVSEIRPASADGAGFVELWNTSGAAVDLGGWILRDDATLPESLSIPQGISIPAGSRIVLAQTPSAAASSWGRLSPARTGGRLSLIRRGTGVAHSLVWPALPAGTSWARIGLHGTGMLAAPTPGSGETRTAAGEAYVSEVCYHPATGTEFVEIASLSDSVIHLGRADTSLSWRLEGAALRFAMSDTLPARGRLVVAFGSGLDAAAFRAAAGVPATVPVVVSAGRLDDAGERIVLAQPHLPATTASGKLSWKTRIDDHAVWSPVPPWPAAADGGGSCLERIDPSIPGDSPLAWKASAPSAGR
jgi:hypothetical protein